MTKKAGIIIPFRDSFKTGERYWELFKNIEIIKNICEKHNQSYKIFVVQQNDNNLFNKAYLMNVGADIAKDECDYFIFHDVDYFSTNNNNVYMYREKSGCLVKQQNEQIFADNDNYFEAVFYINKSDYFAINGHCNYYWGWGWENIRERLINKKISYRRYDGIFKTHFHETKHRYLGNINFINNAIIYHLVDLKLNDGYNTIDYKIVETTNIRNYTITDFNTNMYVVSIPEPQYDVKNILTKEQLTKIIGEYDDNVRKNLIIQYQKQ